MTIKTLPSRYPVLGRLRFGDKEPVMKDGKPVLLSSGKPKMRPAKTSVFRFTSDDEYLLAAVASHFGGDVTPWPGGEQAFSLTSEAGEIECLLPPDPVDTAYELWGSGGCQRRCDGEQCTFLARNGEGDMYIDSGECRCLAEGKTPGDKADPATCNVTVRIRILLPHLPGIGVWMGTSHSVYAAMELPAQLLIVRAATAHLSRPDFPVLIPAVLALDHREEKKPFEKYKRDFYVVSLRGLPSFMQLDTLARGNGELVEPERREIAAPRPALAAGATPPPPAPPPPVGNGTKASPYAKPAHVAATKAGLSDAQLDTIIASVTGSPSANSITREHWPAVQAAITAAGSGPTTPPAAPSPSVAPAGAPSPTGPAGDGPKPFLRVLQTRARALRLSDEQLAEIITEELAELRGAGDDARFALADIAGPAEANSVLEALGRYAAAASE